MESKNFSRLAPVLKFFLLQYTVFTLTLHLVLTRLVSLRWFLNTHKILHDTWDGYFDKPQHNFRRKRHLRSCCGNHSHCKPGVTGLINSFSSLSDETLSCGPVSICCDVKHKRTQSHTPWKFWICFIRLMSSGIRFPTMWYVRPAKPQISLQICAVWSEPLLVACIFN